MRSSLLLAFVLGAVVAWGWRGPRTVSAAGTPDFADVVARADASVVHVTTRIEGERPAASRDDAVGAGFVIREDGLVVTSLHVLRSAERVLVSVKGRGTWPATVVGQDEVTDVAVLRVPATGLVPLRAGDPSALRVGDWVLAAGSPFHLARSWSAGIVSGLRRSQVGVALRGFEDFIQTDAAANLGSSGGPLLNASGEVVGMMTAILSRSGRSEGVSLAVPVDVVMEAALRLAASPGRPIARPSLGMVVREVDVHGTGQPGLVVTRFHERAPAAAAGLREGDVILAVGGRPTVYVSDLQRATWATQPGQSVAVVFARDGRRFEVSVTPR
jgi:serine protease Do